MNFPNISERLYLSFINTRIVKHSKTHELITSESDLENWLAFIYDNFTNYQPAMAVCRQLLSELTEYQLALHELLTFRESLYHQLDAITHGGKMADFIQEIEKNINELKPKIACIDRNVLLVPQSETFCDSLQMFILSDILDSFSKGDIDKLSHCHNHECVLLFINKTGRRKWCSMEICGNRNKVKNFHNKYK